MTLRAFAALLSLLTPLSAAAPLLAAGSHTVEVRVFKGERLRAVCVDLLADTDQCPEIGRLNGIADLDAALDAAAKAQADALCSGEDGWSASKGYSPHCAEA